MNRLLRLTVVAVVALSALAPVSAGELDDLDFLTGTWRWNAPTGPVEEWWMPAAGNTKVASFRWTQGDRTSVIELVIVSAEEDGTVLRFKHFDPDYATWEKDEPNAYRLASTGNGRAEFRKISANPDVPDVLIYERAGDTLRFRGTNNPDVEAHEDDLVLEFEKVD